MFAKCEMQMVNFMGTELHETEFTSAICGKRTSGILPVIKWIFWAAA